MSKRGMRLLPLSIAIPIFAGLGACATAGPPRTASAPSDVSCSLFAAIPYALMSRVERELATTEGRAVRDEGNLADSDETVGWIERHNARFDTVCGNPLQPPG